MAIGAYQPGRSIEEVAAEIGIPVGEIVKLASNESPHGPFPGATRAAAAALGDSNRYPDNDLTDLSHVLSGWLGVPEENLWFGNGSVGLLGTIALAIGGPGTTAVYGWPSFVMYRLATRWAMAESIEVRLDRDHVHDMEAMLAAIRPDTTVVYLCNPNNPTGTIVPGDGLQHFLDSVPEPVLIVVDEAYHDFVTADRHRSALPAALERDNVVVLRTFSKIFGLAGHRVGYGVGSAATLGQLRKAQAPFSVTQVGQVAAAASLDDPVEYLRRVTENAAGRLLLEGAIGERDLPHSRSQANFVYLELPAPSARTAGDFMAHGVIIRPMSGNWLRVTVGTESENARFLSALDMVLTSL
jgi:histidinol-phosphate aminotransferase